MIMGAHAHFAVQVEGYRIEVDVYRVLPVGKS